MANFQRKGNTFGITLPTGTNDGDIERVLREQAKSLKDDERALIESALANGTQPQRQGDMVWFLIDERGPGQIPAVPQPSKTPPSPAPTGREPTTGAVGPQHVPRAPVPQVVAPAMAPGAPAPAIAPAVAPTVSTAESALPPGAKNAPGRAPAPPAPNQGRQASTRSR